MEWVYVSVYRSPRKPETSEPLDMALLAVVSQLIWLLGIKLGSSAKVASVSNIESSLQILETCFSAGVRDFRQSTYVVLDDLGLTV